MEFGVRAFDLGYDRIEIISQRAKERGFASVQLPLEKTIKGFNNSKGKLSPGFAHHIKKIFDKDGVKIVVMGNYFNMIHPDIQERKNGIQKFKEHLRYCRDFGCSIVGTETGSYNADLSFHKDNNSTEAFKTCMSTLQELVEEAERFGVIVGLEPSYNTVINTMEKAQQALDFIDSNNLQIILDIGGILTIDNYLDQDKIINNAFELFSDRIVVIHAKDFIVKNGEMMRVAPGNGMENFDLILKRIKENRPYIDFIIEDLKQEDMKYSMDLMTEKYEKI